MLIKMLPGNPCHSVLMQFSGKDFSDLGICGSEITLNNTKSRMLLGLLFDTAEKACGLRRDGNLVSVACRPLKDGGCRFYICFTDKPSGRLFSFAGADDLLDALNELQSSGKRDLFSTLEITNSGERYSIYIPAGAGLSQRALAVLNEYSV